MGKSRFLQRLAAEAAQRWAVLLQALDHRNLLRDFPQPPDLTQEHLVQLLAAAAGVATSSSAESTQRCLKAALYDSGDIAVFIDGVDEICPSYKDKLVRLLEMLLETKVKLVWVSSRPEAELVLTKALRCATSSLRPFSEEEQKNHLCGQWSSVDPRNRPPAAFAGLAAEMVAALHGAAGRGQRSLLDVPLHAQMAAEAYATQAARALGTGVSLLPQSGISLYQLYRRFVERKRDLYERRFGLNDANSANLPSADNFEVVHQNCAMLVLVSDGTFSTVDPSPFRDYLHRNRQNLIKEKTGILWLGEGEDDMPHFLHYTFIEYFAARWLLENQEKGTEVAKVWRSILNCDVGVGVRHILEHMLSDGLPLHRAVLEGSEGALEAALEAGGDPDESDRFGRTALVQAASLGRADAVGALLAKGCDPGRRDALLGWTALRYASACGHLEAAERLLQAGADPKHFDTHVDVRELVFEAAEWGYPAVRKSHIL
ncbi:hypothetical protein R5R35_014465 [Gryllus longicercus]|uniref:NACHT domain-containing protein n=1 Tax=Gryllus longicercus TaxID=2509291 RepID=A0AAN9YTF3_9ORTH